MYDRLTERNANGTAKSRMSATCREDAWQIETDILDRLCEIEDKIARAIADGMTNSVELCETFGITEKTLKTYKCQMGIKTGRPKRNYRHCARTNAIAEDLKEGELKICQIARKHGVKSQTVDKVKRKLKEDGEL